MPININELTVSASGKKPFAPGLDTLPQALARLAQLETKVALLQSVMQALQSALEVTPFSTTIKGRTVDIQADNMSIQSRGNIEMQAPGRIVAGASQFTGNTGVAHFAGVVKCSLLQAETVMGTSYTPGAGNLA
ncbi:MAG: hypothetical protein HY820_42590 [Acidobacteria bacterium]|nr:hypothetical protein [Acidobacteriota bacterium]